MADVGTSVAKFLKHPEHLGEFQNGPTWPLHVSVLCTSRCQMDCPFCIWHNRETGKDMDLDVFYGAVRTLYEHGLRAVQLSGGDPFAWPHIDAAISRCNIFGIPIGIQSNGIQAHEHVEALKSVKWLRVGIYTDEQMARLRLGEVPKNVNLSITTVWHKAIETDFLRRFRDYGRQLGVGYARVVQDWFAHDSEHAQQAIALVKELGTPLVFVPRTNDSTDFCAVAWWKVAMDWFGYLYACGCIGIQGNRRLPKHLRICRADKISRFYSRRKPRDLGHRCTPCPYREHNAILKSALKRVDDPEFL